MTPDFDLRGQIVNTQYNADEINIQYYTIINGHTTNADPDPYADYLQSLFERVDNFLKNILLVASGDIKEHAQTIQTRLVPAPDVVKATYASVLDDPLVSVIGKRYEKPKGYYQDVREAYIDFKGRLLLLGEPGAGKTISLLLFARDSIVRRLQDPTQPLPILGIVPTWNYESETAFSDWLQASYGVPENVKSILEAGEALLILDGLDELMPNKLSSADPQAMFLQRLPENNKIVLTCRIHNSQFLTEFFKLNGAVTVSPLTMGQIESYLVPFPNLKSIITSEQNLSSLLDTPFMLGLFAEAYHDADKEELDALLTISDKFHLQHKIIDLGIRQRFFRLCKNTDSDFQVVGLDNLFNGLEFISSAMLLKGPFEDQTTVSVDELDKYEGNLDDLIDTAINLRILVLASEKSYRFSHLFFRDFFALQYCLNNFTILAMSTRGANIIAYLAKSLDFQNDDFGHERYQNEVISKAAEIIRYDEMAERNDSHIFGAMVALNAFGETAKDEYLLLLKENDPRIIHRTVSSLIMDVKPFAIPILKDLLSNDQERVRSLAIDGLVKIKDIQLIPIYLELLEHDDYYLRITSSETLIAYGKAAVDTILEKTEKLRSFNSINKHIKENDLEEAIKLLIERALQKDGDRNDVMAAILLCILGDEEIINNLMTKLSETTDKQTESEIFWLLIQLGKTYPEHFMSYLNSKVDRIRDLTARALGQISYWASIHPLIAATHDPNAHVRYAAAGSLVKFGLDILDQLLNEAFEADQDFQSEGQVIATILAEIEKGTVNDSKKALFAAILALLGMSNPDVTPTIINELQKQNEMISIPVRYALIFMDNFAAEHLLSAMDNHPVQSVRAEAGALLKYMKVI